MEQSRQLGHGIRQRADEQILREVEVCERATGEERGVEGGVDVVEGEREEGEVGQVAEGRGERAHEVEVGEVERGDGGAGAGDAGPVTRREVVVSPAGEEVARVGEATLGLEKKEAFLGEGGGEVEAATKEEEREERRPHGSLGVASWVLLWVNELVWYREEERMHLLRGGWSDEEGKAEGAEGKRCGVK